MSRTDRGQASVELVALLPVLALLGLAVWQAALAGHAVWAAGAAARAGSRAAAVGGDAETAARALLPRALARTARVRSAADGAVAVRVAIRAPGGGRVLARYTATARFAAQR